MENPTGKKVGKLYALFLEASKEYVKSKLHQELKLPEESGEIYRQLVRRTCGGDNTKYKRFIWKHKKLSNENKRFLTPQNRVVDVESKDFSKYAMIIRLLSRPNKVMQYMTDKRNEICHYSVISLDSNMPDDVFVYKWYDMLINFEIYKFDKEFLRSLWETIAT